MLNYYNIGDVVKLSLVITADGVATDPGTLTLRVKPPATCGVAAAEVDYLYGTDAALVRDSTGRYHLFVTVNAPGVWHYKWVATGNGAGAKKGSFTVTKDDF